MTRTVILLMISILLAGAASAQENGLVEPLFPERPDSSYIQLLRSLERNRFEIRFTNGDKFKGRIRVEDEGVSIISYKHRNLSESDRSSKLVPWDEIQSIRVLKKRSSWPVVTFVSAGLVLVYLLACLSGS